MDGRYVCGVRIRCEMAKNSSRYEMYVHDLNLLTILAHEYIYVSLLLLLGGVL